MIKVTSKSGTEITLETGKGDVMATVMGATFAVELTDDAMVSRFAVPALGNRRVTIQLDDANLAKAAELFAELQASLKRLSDALAAYDANHARVLRAMKG